MGKSHRLLSLLVSCPKCRVPVGVACCGKRGARKAPHRERMYAAPAHAPAAPPREAPGSFYRSDAWRTLRYQALRRSSGACECCGTGPSPGRPLHVDHIKSRSRFPNLALDLSNLQVLCADCNLGKGAVDQTDWRPVEGRLQ
ncbi:HNH endonuclease [uncultured Methylobacterium sp.]|uniref:HNH endonuclease n=1 Tax=uncultured Methylobacterium sp. TaxID=157278 RepID=UPI0035CC0F0B